MNRVERVLGTIYDVRFLLVVVIITVMVAILYPIQQNRVTNDSLKRTVEQTRQSQLANAHTSQQIEDCSVPSGKCFQESEKRLKGALEQIRLITVVANACAVIATKDPNLQEEQEILQAIDSCITKGLARGGGR